MPVLPNSSLPGPGDGGSIGSQISGTIGGSLLNSIGLNQVNTTSRQNVNSMFQYTTASGGPSAAVVFPSASNDWRVRVSLAPGSDYFYNDPSNSLLSPLVSEVGVAPPALFANSLITGHQRIGVIFPYTPQITVQHTANYSPQKLTHSNYAQYYYDNSEVQAIQVTTDFTVQNINEGQYLLAAIYFFRSCTKMFFGADPNAGNPPPLVYLNGYGQYYFPNVPCVITSFSHTMPADCDYIDVPEPAATNTGYPPRQINYRLNSTRLPTTSSVTVTLQPVYSRFAQSRGFSLSDFAKGALINPVGTGSPASAFGASQGARNVKDGNRSNGGFI